MAVEVDIRLGPAYDAVEFTPAEVSRLAQAAMAGMERFVRWDTGNLNASAHVEGDTVVYDPRDNGVSYAAFTFANTHNRVTRTGHPQATARWDRAYARSGMPEVMEEAARIVNGR